MKDIAKVSTILIVLVLLGLVFATRANAQDCGNNSPNFCQVKPQEFYDGDTFYVDIPKLHSLFGTRLGVRVAKVDTPEVRGGSAYEKEMGKKAKEFTENALSNAKRVDLRNCVKGKFFRIVCDVIYDGKSLGDELINAKLAVPYGK